MGLGLGLGLAGVALQQQVVALDQHDLVRRQQLNAARHL